MTKSKKKKSPFRLWHSFAIGMIILILEGIACAFFKSAITIGVLLFLAAVGGTGIIYIATEVIRDVRNADHMLLTLSLVIAEFILFFSFQYWFISLLVPGSFSNLVLDPVSLLLNSTMIFALNPLYQTVTLSGKSLLLINTLDALALVFFVLQNIWQFRPKSEDSL